MQDLTCTGVRVGLLRLVLMPVGRELFAEQDSEKLRKYVSCVRGGTKDLMDFHPQFCAPSLFL